MEDSSKVLIAKVIVSLAIIVANILLVPQFLVFLGYFKDHTIRAPSVFVEELDFFGNVALLITDREFLIPFLYIQPAILVLILLIFWKEKLFKKKVSMTEFGTPQKSGHGEFGTSRWATIEEVSKETTVWKLKPNANGEIEPPKVPKNPYATKPKELKNKVPVGGNVLGMSLEHRKAWLDTQDTNTLIIGTSRSGKTRTQVYPTIWTTAKSGESMIITDPKGEIHELTRSYVESMGYDVVLLDFRDPSRGNHWNVLQPIIDALNNGDEAKAANFASEIAHGIVHQKKRTGDPIWANGEKSVIEATILAVVTSNVREDQKNMPNVYQNIIELGQPKYYEDDNGNLMEVIPLNEYFNSLPPGHIAKNAFGVAALSPEKQRGSFFSGAASSLRVFSDPNMSFLTKTHDHSMRSIGQRPTVVYLCIPDETSNLHMLASLYINQVYLTLVDEANLMGGRLKNRVNNLLDEFGNMPAIPDFDTKVTVSLGRGIRWTLIVQDLQQLKTKYGDEANTITGNCHTWIYLLTTDTKTAEELSKRTGTYTIETESRSASIQERGSSRSQSENLTKRALLTPDEILRWPKERSLLFMARNHPANLPLPDVSKWSYAMHEMKPTIIKGTKKIVPSEIFLLNQVPSHHDERGDADYMDEEDSEDVINEEDQPRGVFAKVLNSKID